MTLIGDSSSDVATQFKAIPKRHLREYLKNELFRFNNGINQRCSVYGDLLIDVIYVTTEINGKTYYGASDSLIKDSAMKERRNYIAQGDRLVAMDTLARILSKYDKRLDK